MQDYVEYFRAIFFFGLIGAVLLWIAKSNGFFVLPHSRDLQKTSRHCANDHRRFCDLSRDDDVGCARLWHGCSNRSMQFFQNMNPPVALLGWVQLFILLGILFLFYLYSKAQEPDLFKRVWKDKKIPHPKPVLIDFLMGVMTWVISFPLVIAIGQLADMILYFVYGYENYEQVAVRYLKTTLGSPPMLAVALFTILIAAPIIEEFLVPRMPCKIFSNAFHPQKCYPTFRSLFFPVPFCSQPRHRQYLFSRFSFLIRPLFGIHL